MSDNTPLEKDITQESAAGGEMIVASDSDKKLKTISKVDMEMLKKEISDLKVKYDPARVGSNLRQLIADDIEAFKKREKTRVTEIIGIFAAHNYYANGFSPVELRTTLEDLGPTYIKIGQIMSSRVDLLPEDYCKELEKLRQNVKPLDPAVARAVIEEETGMPIDEIFSEFRDEPLGSASIGQAHYGVLKDGTEVVTKVQRPLIADMMRQDYVILKKLAGLVNIVADDEGGQTIDLISALDEMEKVTNEELDFRIEAEHTKFFKENCIEDEDVISCPTVYDELTTERIFTMSFVKGVSVAKKDKIIENGWDIESIARAITENYIHQVLDVGTFHADPHQGNIIVSEGKPYWIDFGMIGHVTSKDIDTMTTVILALISADAPGVIDCIYSMGIDMSGVDRDKLTDDAESMLKKYANVKSINDIDVAVLLDELMSLVDKHNIKIPSEYTMLGRSLITIEGVIEELCPTLDLFTILTEKMKERTKQSFDLKQIITDVGKGTIKLTKKTLQIPGLAADALAALSKGKMRMNVEFTGLDEPLAKIGEFVKYIVLSILACVLFIGSCILCSVDIEPKMDNGMPAIAVVGIVFSIALAIYSVRKMSRK